MVGVFIFCIFRSRNSNGHSEATVLEGFATKVAQLQVHKSYMYQVFGKQKTLQYITVQNRLIFSDQCHRCAHVTEEASQMESFQSSVTPLWSHVRTCDTDHWTCDDFLLWYIGEVIVGIAITPGSTWVHTPPTMADKDGKSETINHWLTHWPTHWLIGVTARRCYRI